MPQRYKMTIAYDGTSYAGWQVQPGQRTIQGELERVLAQITGEGIRVFCSGRTDTGVHARGQVAHFDCTKRPTPRELMAGCNGLLGRDIRVLLMQQAPSTFNARESAIEKEYRYHIYTGRVVPPFIAPYRYHLPYLLDVDAMRRAAEKLAGCHDFAAFSANPNRPIHDTTRRIARLMIRHHGNHLMFLTAGDGFLYKMVRSLVGFLVQVGKGRSSTEDVQPILKSRTRTGKVPSAPPHGLFLWKVTYRPRPRQKS